MSSNGLRKRSARSVRRTVFNSVALRASLGAHCPWHRRVRTTGLDRLRWPPDLQRPSRPSGYLLRRSATRSNSMRFFRVTGAVLLVAAGFALMLPRLQIQFALAAAPLGNWTQQKFGSTATADCAANSALDYCSAPSGSGAWGPPWAPPPFSRLRAGAWVWLHLLCCSLVSAVPFP